MSTDFEFHLLLEAARGRDLGDEFRRWRRTGIYSIAFHALLLLILFVLPETPVRPINEPIVVRHVTPLYIPTEFTQKAPNKGKIEKELTAEAIAPRPQVRRPAPAPAANPGVRSAAPPPPAPVAPAPKPVLVEPPRLAASDAPLQIAQQLPQTSPQPPPPAVNPSPQLILQDVVPAAPKGPAQGKPTLAAPNPSVQEAIRQLAHNGAPPGNSVGDIGSDDSGIGPGLNLPPSAGQRRSQLELKSDPLGVDFRPYLLQVLAAVRRNWFAVYPEAARLGLRGQVKLEFAIAKQGAVTKVVFATESGAKALDQSAVAAISASNPLPPLPAEFRGDRIVLQMTFQYNMPRQ